MTIKQLKYLIAVADAGSITEASKRLFIAQPSLTASIQELEKELGVKRGAPAGSNDKKSKFFDKFKS